MREMYLFTSLLLRVVCVHHALYVGNLVIEFRTPLGDAKAIAQRTKILTVLRQAFKIPLVANSCGPEETYRHNRTMTWIE